MKNGEFLTFIALIIGLWLVPNFTSATSGACSSHLGVNCLAGSDSDGSVICNDGWRDSSVFYLSTSECSGKSPMCTPDQLSALKEEYGVNAIQQEIDYLMKQSTAKSDEAYALSNGQIIYQGEIAARQRELYTEAQNYSTQAAAKLLSLQNTMVTVNSMCAAKGFDNQTQAQKKLLETVKNQEVTVTCPANSHVNVNICTCNDGYVVNNDKTSCVTYNQACQNQYGVYAYSDKTYCYCSAGYEWNSNKTTCQAIINPITLNQTVQQQKSTQSPTKTPLTKNLKLGNSGDEVTKLQKFLVSKNYLKTKTFGYFGSGTKTALIKYQKANKLKQTGQLDSQTLIFINNHQ